MFNYNSKYGDFNQNASLSMRGGKSRYPSDPLRVTPRYLDD